MNIKAITEYLQDLIDDILAEKEKPRYLAHKIKILMSRLELVEKKEKKEKKFKLEKLKTEKSKIEKIENFSYYT